MNGFEFCSDYRFNRMSQRSGKASKKKGNTMVKVVKSGFILVSEKINDVMPVCYLPACGIRMPLYAPDARGSRL